MRSALVWQMWCGVRNTQMVLCQFGVFFTFELFSSCNKIMSWNFGIVDGNSWRTYWRGWRRRRGEEDRGEWRGWWGRRHHCRGGGRGRKAQDKESVYLSDSRPTGAGIGHTMACLCCVGWKDHLGLGIDQWLKANLATKVSVVKLGFIFCSIVLYNVAFLTLPRISPKEIEQKEYNEFYKSFTKVTIACFFVPQDLTLCLECVFCIMHVDAGFFRSTSFGPFHCRGRGHIQGHLVRTISEWHNSLCIKHYKDASSCEKF